MFRRKSRAAVAMSLPETAVNFDVIKINTAGKRQNRVLSVSERGVGNFSGSSCQWFVERDDVHSVAQHVGERKRFTLSTVLHYNFEGNDERQVQQVVDGFNALNLGRRRRYSDALPPTAPTSGSRKRSKAPVNSGAAVNFTVIKINREGKRQTRTLSFSAAGIANMDGSKVKWFVGASDLVGISQDPLHKTFFTISIQIHYLYEAQDERQVQQIIDTFHKVRLVEAGGLARGEAPLMGSGFRGLANASFKDARRLSTTSNGSDGGSSNNNSNNNNSNVVGATAGAADSDRPAEVTWDDFEIMRIVGQGSFGKVVQARRNGTDEVYAIKMLSKGSMRDTDHQENVKRELKMLQSMHHAYIVELFWSFETERYFCFVMDFAAGGSIAFHLKRKNKFPIEVVQFYMAEIVLALDHLHARKVIFRDLKPENVLIGYDGHVKLADFGLAKGGRGETATSNTFCGTPEYIAPEVLQGHEYGKAADWWSLGIMCFELLTGRTPFAANSRQEMYELALKGDIAYPDDMPYNAQRFIRGMLARSPEARLGSAKGLEEFSAVPFFKTIDWQKLNMKQMQPPWVPQITSMEDVSNFDDEMTCKSLENLTL